MEEKKYHILVVDDVTENIQLAGNILSAAGYRISFAQNGAKTIELAGQVQYDLILLDIMMPEMDGYEVCTRLRKNKKTENTPILFLTAHHDNDVIEKAFEAGGNDYLSKPINRIELLLRIKSHLKTNKYRLELIQAREELEHQNALLGQKVIERTKEISQVQDATIISLASLAEARDKETGNHIKRTRAYVLLLVTNCLKLKIYPDILNEQTGEFIIKSAPLHDIGKVGIPDSILNKPGTLFEKEHDIIKTHTTIGAKALRDAREIVGLSKFLETAEDMVLYHHERWDGTGYPEGLKGDEIPIPGRIMAIADVYDALTTMRIYKDPIGHKASVEMIISESGKSFDPLLVEVFTQVEKEFEQIATQYKEKL
ncbi:MAG: response regulator [Leptospirales bacterium]